MIVKIIYMLILMYIAYIDYKEKIIPDKFIFILFVLSFFHNNISEIYIGAAIFSFPLLLIYLLSLHIEKELIGLGDIKMMISIGAYMGYVNLYILYSYYFFIYLISFIYVLSNRKERYIAFGPMISIVTIIYLFYRINIWEYVL